jgi:hypothetical protein
MPQATQLFPLFPQVLAEGDWHLPWASQHPKQLLAVQGAGVVPQLKYKAPEIRVNRVAKRTFISLVSHSSVPIGMGWGEFGIRSSAEQIGVPITLL